MFFEGSLQDGIATAIQQSKPVVCFVTDDGTESKQWEEEFLTDDSIRPELESQSVILRLVAGSEEAGYLEALFPVPKKPTVVVIKDGQLKEYIAAGTSKEEFIRRLGKTNQSSATQGQPASADATTPAANAAQSEQSTVSQPSHGTDDSLYNDDVQPTLTSTSASTPSQGAQSATVEEEKRRVDKGKGKAKAEPEDDARKKPYERRSVEPENPEANHANELRLRRLQASEERKRILQRIEDDKRARKEREAEERKARRLLSGMTDTDSSNSRPESAQRPQRTPRPGQGEYCNLQVRLLDGSTIRTRFPRDKTLGQDVRKWIDEERMDGNAPYSFRIVLTPLPNKMVEPQEEIKSLLSLGLVPSATLVLVPTRYSAAYAHTGGILSPIFGGLAFLYATVLGFVGRLFALIFGGGAGGDGADHRGPDDVPMENLRRRRSAQLYNGNSLNFEPSNEDDDENDTR